MISNGEKNIICLVECGLIWTNVCKDDSHAMVDIIYILNRHHPKVWIESSEYAIAVNENTLDELRITSEHMRELVQYIRTQHMITLSYARHHGTNTSHNIDYCEVKTVNESKQYNVITAPN